MYELFLRSTMWKNTIKVQLCKNIRLKETVIIIARQHAWKFILFITIVTGLSLMLDSLDGWISYKLENNVTGTTVERQQPSFSKFRWCPNRNDNKKITIDCEKLFKGDKKALKEAKTWESPCSYSDESMLPVTSDCETLKKNFPFWSDKFLTPNETTDYSLAFVLIGAKNAEQIVRLMQAVYNRRNLYCITYDNKTLEEFKQSLRNLDKCYDNIIMPRDFVTVYWGGFSILQTAMYCLKALTETKSHGWKYVQILSWNDYPLRTNEEFVKIMKIFNGAHDSYLTENLDDRSRQYFNVRRHSTRMKKHLDPNKTGQLKNIPPGQLIEFKGSLATTMTREFVEFMFTNKVARDLYDWLNTSYCAEEIYWGTLIHNLHVNPPGGFPGACMPIYKIRPPSIRYVSRYQVWYDESHRCAGKLTSFSCVFGVGDLHRLKSTPAFMAHKLYLDYEPATYYCMAQLHFNKTFFPHRFEKLNETFYENLPAVKYRNMVRKEEFNCY